MSNGNFYMKDVTMVTIRYHSNDLIPQQRFVIIETIRYHSKEPYQYQRIVLSN